MHTDHANKKEVMFLVATVWEDISLLSAEKPLPLL
jgi:hypothetical protein